MLILKLASPLLIKGPVDIRPLNMATINPVALTIRLSTEVKASIKGVNKTPPPIPPITATMAIAKLMKKNPNSHPQMDPADMPPSGVSELKPIKSRAV